MTVIFPSDLLNSNITFTVQLRCKRTTHTHIIQTYSAYTRISICAHIRIYTHTYTYIRAYVSLLCIPISFFMWSIVSQTEFDYQAIIFRVFDHFANSLANYRLLKLAWSWATKSGKKIETAWVTWTLYFNTWTLCLRHMSASHLRNFYSLNLRSEDPGRKK